MLLYLFQVEKQVYVKPIKPSTMSGKSIWHASP